MLQTKRKLGTPNFLYGPRMSGITRCTHDVVLPKWARKSDKGLHWAILPFALSRCRLHSRGADVSQKGDSCSPVPEGECQCMLLLLDSVMGYPLGSGYRVELGFSVIVRQVRICLTLSRSHADVHALSSHLG